MTVGRGAGAVALVVLLATGCGSSGSARPTGGSAPSAPPGPVQSTPSPPSGTSDGTTTTTTAPVAPSSGRQPSTPARCHTSQLAVTDDGGQGAAGTMLGRVTLRNTSNVVCTLFGYAGLQRLDVDRQPQPTTVTRIATRPPALVVVAPQQRASFAYSYRDNPPAGTKSKFCSAVSAATYVEVTPPDEMDFVLSRSSMNPCDPQGTIRVSPIRPGSTGTAASEF